MKKLAKGHGMDDTCNDKDEMKRQDFIVAELAQLIQSLGVQPWMQCVTTVAIKGTQVLHEQESKTRQAQQIQTNPNTWLADKTTGRK